MQALDLRLLLLLHGRPVELLGLMRLLTLSGAYGSIFLPLGAALAIFGRGARRTLGLRLIAGLGIILVAVVLVLKPLVARPRPYMLLGHGFLLGPMPHGFAFPSGHAAVAFAGATVFFLWARRYRLALFLYAILVAWSRLYLGTHWPSDVVAGAAIGILAGFAATKLLPSHRVEVPPDGRTTRRSARRRKVHPGAGPDEP